jgi:hypothetical protein
MGPGDIFLLEFRGEKLERMTNLLAKSHELLLPDYRKAKLEPYNDNFDFVFEEESESAPTCRLDGTKFVRVDAKATTDPKHLPGTRAWDARFRATWDISQGKFTSKKVTRLFAGVRAKTDHD